jgi:hypothetical protein
MAEPVEPGPESGAHGTPRCGAHARSTGKPCKRGAGAGTSHPGWGNCSRHGGNSPNGLKYAERLAAEAAADQLGLPVSTTAADALQDALDRSNGVVRWLAAKLQEIDVEELTWGTTQQRIRPPAKLGDQPMVEVTRTARVHPLFSMYERSETRLTRIAEAMAKLGIEERRAAVFERDGAAIAALLEGMLTEFRAAWQLSPAQQAEARVIVGRVLRERAAIESGG